MGNSDHGTTYVRVGGDPNLGLEVRQPRLRGCELVCAILLLRFHARYLLVSRPNLHTECAR